MTLAPSGSRLRRCVAGWFPREHAAGFGGRTRSVHRHHAAAPMP